MKQQIVLYGVIGLFGGILIGIYVSSYTTNTSQSGVMKMMGIRNNKNSVITRNSNSIDQHFIEQMVPHHEDAIVMANLALQKAKRNEIKTLAKNIIKSQSQEINMMKAWYRSWFGTDTPTGSNVMNQHGMMGNGGLHMGMTGTIADSQRLENAPDFDKAFIEGMIPHHQMAVMMAYMLKNGSQRTEMTKLADDIVTAQTSEIDQMRAWYSEWYK